MANPQAENGHTDIANEIMEAFARYFPGGCEGQILWVVLRKTYGWHKNKDAISISQLIEATNSSRRSVIYGLQNLEAKKIIIVERRKDEPSIISFNKNYDTWLVQNSAPQVKQNRNRSKVASAKLRTGAKLGNEVVQNSVNNVKSFAPTKETNTKETKQKKYAPLAKRQNTDVNEVITHGNLVLRTWPGDRKAIYNLMRLTKLRELRPELEPADRVKWLIDIVAASRRDEYSTRIGSYSQLLRKYSELLEWFGRKKGSQPIVSLKKG